MANIPNAASCQSRQKYVASASRVEPTSALASRSLSDARNVLPRQNRVPAAASPLHGNRP
jgi:hypothetical protein